MGGSINTTYSKDDLLGIFRQQDQNGNGLREVKDLILGDLGPGSGGGWSRSGDDGAGGAGAEVCWEKDGGLKPVSLEEMVEEEREVCFLFFVFCLPSYLKHFTIPGDVVLFHAAIRRQICSWHVN